MQLHYFFSKDQKWVLSLHLGSERSQSKRIGFLVGLLSGQ